MLVFPFVMTTFLFLSSLMRETRGLLKSHVTIVVMRKFSGLLRSLTQTRKPLEISCLLLVHQRAYKKTEVGFTFSTHLTQVIGRQVLPDRNALLIKDYMINFYPFSEEFLLGTMFYMHWQHSSSRRITLFTFLNVFFLDYNLLSRGWNDL